MGWQLLAKQQMRMDFGQVIEIAPELYDDFRFIALDVETANGWIGSICQVGLCGVRADGSMFNVAYYVNPHTDFAEFNVQLHGISFNSVKTAPSFDELMAELAPILARQPLISHSSFDKRAFQAASEHTGFTLPNLQWFDSVRIARAAWPELLGNGGHGLGSLKLFLDIDFQHHDAGEDARAAAVVVVRAESATIKDFTVLNGLGGTAGRSRQAERVGNKFGRYWGLKIAFTGGFETTRLVLEDRAVASGFTVTTQINQKLDYLVIGKPKKSTMAMGQVSSKIRKAREMISLGYEIRMMSEVEYTTLIIDAD